MTDKLNFELLEVTPTNPLLSRCKVKVCYVDNKPNRNGSVLTKATISEAAPTLLGCPIVGYFNEQKGDFEGHNEIIEFDTHTGEVKFKVLTFPYGFVPLDAKIWFQQFNEDGKIREYLCTEGIIWTGQFPESKKIFEDPEGKGQSMELHDDSTKGFYDKKGYFIINETIFSKLCVLGDDVEPCFEGARVIPQFSLNKDFNDKISYIKNQYQLTEDKKKDMDLEKELSEYKAKFELLEKQYKELQGKLDTANKQISEYSALNLEQKNADLEKSLTEANDKYTKLEEEAKTNYSKLEEETKEKYSKLEEETKTLREFKAAADLKEKENMINSFSMLTEEDKKDVKENIQNYSLEEIESKLAVVCFRKKISYGEDKAKETEITTPLTYSLNEGGTTSPDWIKAVKETESKLYV